MKTELTQRLKKGWCL
jgi:hypothetical protein